MWLPDKVKRVMEAFDEGADLVLHNAYITDKELNITEYSFFNKRGSKKGVLHNIMKNSYMGCCMAFDKKLLKHIMPVPKHIPMHDQWIGLRGEKYGNVHLIDHPYILYRRHSENVSGGGSSLLQKIKWRINIIGCMLRK